MDDTGDNEELKQVLDSIADGKDPLPPVDITKIEPPIVEDPLPPELPAPPAPAPTEVVEAPSTSVIDAPKLVKQYLDVYEKFLTNYDSDRDQIEKTIKHLEDVVFNVGSAQRVHIEMLVAALRTKAETNGNIVKAMDSVAKILAAAKGTQILINNSNGNMQKDLAAILKTPLYPDEQR